MEKGELAIVLHAHLPYVRSARTGSLEEDWFFQALIECYIPLVRTIQESTFNKEENPKITIGLSPTLLSLLENKDLCHRFSDWTKKRILLLKKVPQEQKKAATHLENFFEDQLIFWESVNHDLIKCFARLWELKVIDLLTCAATHGYLPLLREHPETVFGQLKTAVREHSRIFGSNPHGIWLPECAYYEGLDKLMNKAGLKYAVLDGHGILNSEPRPRYGLYAPICTSNGVAFFGRDSESTLPVWSAKDGYPGNPVYREFHRDLGWDMPIEELSTLNIKEPRPLGLKLHKVTGRNVSLNKKYIYDPKDAEQKAKQDSIDYLKGRIKQLDNLKKAMKIGPVLIAPFDAELFGHWWFEGPIFLAEIFSQSRKLGIKLTRLCDILNKGRQIQLCNPSPSSWGRGGYHDYWLNESNSWVIPKWSKAGKIFVNICTEKSHSYYQKRLLKQAAIELLLSQASDWSFILRAGTTVEIAKARIDSHLNKFWYLINLIEKDNYNENHLISIENEDNIFPSINYKDWSSIKNYF